MMILVLKTVIFKCISEYRSLALPHHDSTFKVVFFHAQFDDLSLTFPNLRGKFNFGVFVESKKKKIKSRKKRENFFFLFFNFFFIFLFFKL